MNIRRGVFFWFPIYIYIYIYIVFSIMFSTYHHVFNIPSKFALNKLYVEDRADLKHTVATRRIRLSYPEVLISWQITGIVNSCSNVYPLPSPPHPHLPRGVGLAAGAWNVLKKHVPGNLNMYKCRKVSKCDLLLLCTNVNVRKYDYSWEWITLGG